MNSGTTTGTTLSQNGLTELLYGPLPPDCAGAIGCAACWSSPPLEITECDLILNSANYTWSTDTPTPANAMDVETVTLHELGHWLKLLDLYGSADAANDSAKVMFGFGGAGPAYTKRSLHADDIAGAQWIYGAPANCTYSISPARTTFAAGGGTDSVGVFAGAGCAWTATSSADWITITAGSGGTGDGTVSYSVGSNSGTARSGSMTIAGQTFTVDQDGLTCSYSISPQSISLPSTGWNGTITVMTTTGCPWTATSNASWVTITAGAAGSGNGSVSYNVAANSNAARSGSVTVAGQAVQIDQAAVSCTFQIAPVQLSFAASGGTGTVAVTAPAGCAWSATSGVAWISITYGAAGSGGGTVGYAVAANAGSARSGTIAIADKIFTAFQDAQSCNYSLTPTTMNFTEGGGSGSFAVNVGPGCSWTAASSAGWIHITGAASRVGPATVSFSVDANTGAARSASIVVQGLAFTVSQSGVGCSFTLTPSSASVGPTGGEGTFAVAAGAGCTWLAMPAQDWLHVLGSNTASGPGSIHYLVDSNTGPTRDGAIALLQGPQFTVHQAASYGGMAFSHWLPVVSHTDVPARNSHWRSDIAILNRSASTAAVELRLHLSGMVLSKGASLGPNAMAVFKDVVAELAAGLGAVSGSGALEVWSDQDLYVTARTYNQLAAGQTYGQNYDGAEPDDTLLSAGRSAWLPQLAQNTLFRTNIGVTNTSNASANVTLALFDTQGNRVWSGSRDLGAGEFYQYDQPFNAIGGMEQGYATVTVNSGSGITAYASVIDQATGDPTTITMKH